MKDIFLKRNELEKASKQLRISKFKNDLTHEQIVKLIKEQNDIYKKYKLYDEYLKIKNSYNK